MSGLITDDAFLVSKSGRGFHIDTFKDRRELVKGQLRMLFLDAIFHTGKTRAEDERTLEHIRSELVGLVNAMPAEVISDWYDTECDEDPEAGETNSASAPSAPSAPPAVEGSAPCSP